MRYKLLIGVFVLFAVRCMAQANGDIVATRWTGSNEIFNRLSVADNGFHDIETLAGVESLAQGETCYDPVHGRYFRLTNLGITVVDAVSGRIINSIPSDYFIGLEYDPIAGHLVGARWTGKVMMLATVDIESGRFTDVRVLDSVKGVNMGESTFDMDHQRYFLTTNLGTTVIDAVSGKILDSIKGQLMGIEYDPLSNSVIGISWRGFVPRLTSLDLATRTFRIVKDLPEIHGISLGETSFDPFGRRYIMNSGHTIVVINAANGDIPDTVPDTYHIKGMEYAYTQRLFQANDNALRALAYPNPATGPMNIELDENLNNACILIRSMDGRTVYSDQHFSGKVFTTDVSNFPRGIYSVIIRDNKRSVSLKVLKR